MHVSWGLGPQPGHEEFWQARMAAVRNRRRKFTFACGACLANTEHRTDSGLCVICAPDEPRNRALRRARNERYYNADCANCGPDVEHWVRTGGCAACTSISGSVRVRPGFPGARCEERDAARKAGSTTYPGVCKLHGAVEHHTRRGLCLSCYDTLGRPRADLFVRYCSKCRFATVHDGTTWACIEHETKGPTHA